MVVELGKVEGVGAVEPEAMWEVEGVGAVAAWATVAVEAGATRAAGAAVAVEAEATRAVGAAVTVEAEATWGAPKAAEVVVTVAGSKAEVMPEATRAAGPEAMRADSEVARKAVEKRAVGPLAKEGKAGEWAEALKEVAETAMECVEVAAQAVVGWAVV